MLSRHAPIAIAIVSFIGFGCGGSSSKPDGGGGGSSAGGAGGTMSSTGSGGLGGGAAGSTGTAGSAMPTGSIVFQSTQATLLDLGAPCTMEEGATGDRWCAFFGPSQVMVGNAALFVVNVTRAAVAGTSITCGTTDPNCLKLIDSFGEEQFHPAMFQGDTLVYYDALTGTPFGWRPGMTAGRALAVADANTDLNLCTPGTKGNTIWCLRDLAAAMQTDPTLILSDLLAGHLDATADPPLAKIETLISVSAADMFSHFEVDFPGGGDTIAWSARSVASGPEVLKMQTLGNDASRVTVASGVNSWLAQPDGSRWYWLSNVSETNGVGALQSAPFPAGTSPIMVAGNVAQFGFPNPTSLLVVDSAKVMTSFTPPITAAVTGAAFDTGVLGFIQVSAQGHAAYVKMAKSNSAGSLTGIDLYVKKAGDATACTLTATTDAYPFNFSFTPSGVGATWIQKTLTSGNAQFTRFSDCNKMLVGNNVVFSRSLGNRGILFLDTVDNTTGTAVARLRTLGSDGALTADAPSAVSGGVGSLIALASGTTDILVYTVNNGGNEDGVYVRGFGP
jgi:hypothetical protein